MRWALEPAIHQTGCCEVSPVGRSDLRASRACWRACSWASKIVARIVAKTVASGRNCTFRPDTDKVSSA